MLLRNAYQHHVSPLENDLAEIHFAVHQMDCFRSLRYCSAEKRKENCQKNRTPCHRKKRATWVQMESLHRRHSVDLLLGRRDSKNHCCSVDLQKAN
mmetsp:Transcript_86202/g.248922  ORF Transcript_86202/g.248922 Transcript_86202/m.248922 type:complete len:96 (-) Transcript_86202:2192-2479(-)